MNNFSTLEEQLAIHGEIVYRSEGDSMEPFIVQGRDMLVIRRREGKLGKYDVPLYKRSSGQYVLHRIHGVRSDGYVLCGDNRISLERGVTDDMIVGVLHSVIREGREIPLDTLAYRLYCVRICDLYFLRFIRFKFRALLRYIAKAFRR